MTNAEAKVALTPRSYDLLIAHMKDAGNWSGAPLVGGNVTFTKEDRGNLTQLKIAGLIKTEVDEDRKDLTWMYFTRSGKELASELGIELEAGYELPE